MAEPCWLKATLYFETFDWKGEGLRFVYLVLLMSKLFYSTQSPRWLALCWALGIQQGIKHLLSLPPWSLVGKTDSKQINTEKYVVALPELTAKRLVAER